MRQSKSQQREYNHRQSARRASIVRKTNVMSSSAERKEVPQSRILRLLRRLRDGWGMILFTVLLSVYLTIFYKHTTSAESPGSVPVFSKETKPKDALPLHSYLVIPTAAEYQDTLPGSISSTSTTFEIDKADKSVRDANVLPGAIGLEGSFDSEAVKIFKEIGLPATGNNETKSAGTPTPSSRPMPEDSTDKKGKTETTEGEAKSEPAPSSRESESTEIVSTGEEEKRPVKKKKKKKRKKKAKASAKASEGSDRSTDSTGAKSRNNKKKERKRRKRKGKKIGDVSGDSSASQSEMNEAGSKGPGKRRKRKRKRKRKSDGEDTDPGKDSTSLNTTARSENEPSEKDPPPVYDGPRPMDRKMEELQVPGETGSLDEDAVKGYYGKLVKAYLAPFVDGITRRAFFNVLRRKTYSLSPPGSNKGVQTILFQLIKKKLFLMDPYEVMKNSKPFYKTRVNELIWLLSEVAKGGKVPDTEFLVAIHDCVQTVNANHTYRGAVFQESNPTFTIVSCNFSDNIPIPMWEGDPVRGGLKSWDKKMEVYKGADKTPWAEKKERAVFRGGNRPSMFFKKKGDADERCDDAGRSRLSFLGKAHPELFDVSVSGRWCGTRHVMTPLSEGDHHHYKYILYAEGNCFWADRLNKQVFGPSAIVKQETPCGQFWEPLLKPMTHYIPTNFFFQDTVDRIEWAKEHDAEVQAIVKNANEFAGNFLSEKGIKTYVEVLLTEYTKLLRQKDIEPEKGSRDVTTR